ncbi:fumarylacetoacetate hydrolase family protein [Burkholderia multivorans]|uniref:fumarylacetoacetate hydrolase family protein n=1 Tax=Burkholderia multivorans TaxID=87883 RepID=UPI0021BF6C7B|nr:fumarylacetoacetate hydrolase family protein [Burkholderia multivorans]
MRFVAFQRPGGSKRDRMMGTVIGDRVAVLTDIDAFYDDVGHWRSIAANIEKGEIETSRLVLVPPVPRDAKIVCAAINYAKHGEEAKLDAPPFPNLFARWSAELVAEDTPVPVPVAEADGLDWEVELAAIVGATLTDVDARAAAMGVFGYTVSNDISGRASQLQATTLRTGQWALGKNVEKSGAISAFVTTADEVDVSNLRLETIVNGEVMQSGTTADMIFSVGELIAFTSRHVTLRPGDVILTGTPDGVGMARKPPIFMKPGSTVTARIDGLGSITNTIVDSRHRG